MGIMLLIMSQLDPKNFAEHHMTTRSSDGGNRSHNVSLPIILKKTKVGQILQYSCIS